MDLVDRAVQHKVFGDGTICECQENVISVQFESGVKRFIFPDAFRKHLVMREEKGRLFVEDILDDIDKDIRIKTENEMREEEKRKILRSLPLHSNAQAAFGFIKSNKQDVIDTGTVFVGTYLSGYNRGKPRIATRIYPNSACLLTYCEKNDVEENRYIWGAFMVKEDFIGAHCSDGMIPAHKKYRIILNKEERKYFKFWDYLKHELKNQSAKWGSVEVKYFSNATMCRILNDILLVKKGTEQQQLCEEFLDYFFKLNRIDKRQISDLLKDRQSPVDKVI